MDPTLPHSSVPVLFFPLTPPPPPPSPASLPVRGQQTMTVTRVAATVVFLGLQFLPTFTSCGRAPFRSVLLAPLTWALALTFSFTAMWECEYDTLSLNLLFGGATGVFMGNQFSSEWHRRPRDWATRLVGTVLLLLYVVVGSLLGNGRLVESYGPRICEVASQPTPLGSFAASPDAYGKVAMLAVLLVAATISGRALLPWRWFPPPPPPTSPFTSILNSDEDVRDGRHDEGDPHGGGGGVRGSSSPRPPMSDAGPVGDVSRVAAAAAVYRCLMAGALVSTLYGWNLVVDLEDPRNVAFAFASVRTRDWAVLSIAVVAEVIGASVGVVVYARDEQPMSWDEYKHAYLPSWPFGGCASAVAERCRGDGGGRGVVLSSSFASNDASETDVEYTGTPPGGGNSTHCAPGADHTPVRLGVMDPRDEWWAHRPPANTLEAHDGGGSARAAAPAAVRLSMLPS